VVNGSFTLHASVAFVPRKKSLAPMGQEARWAPYRSARRYPRQKSLLLRGIENPFSSSWFLVFERRRTHVFQILYWAGFTLLTRNKTLGLNRISMIQGIPNRSGINLDVNYKSHIKAKTLDLQQKLPIRAILISIFMATHVAGLFKFQLSCIQSQQTVHLVRMFVEEKRPILHRSYLP
jgi:hypothetical protein